MRTFALHFEDRRPYTVTVAASSFDEARSLAEEKLDTGREGYADGEACRVLTRHTCTDSQEEDRPQLVRYVLEFTEEHSARVEVDAACPDDAEDEVREHWDFYAFSARYSGGFVLGLRSAEPVLVWQGRQVDTTEAPF